MSQIEDKELYDIVWDLRYDDRPHTCGDTEYCDGWHGDPDPDDEQIVLAIKRLLKWSDKRNKS